MDTRTRRRMEALAEATHEKCEDGTHWNGKKNKCEKVPGAVATASQQAHQASAGAKDASSHTQAMFAHGHAAEVAQHYGFSDLAASHTAKGKEHGSAVGSKSGSVGAAQHHDKDWFAKHGG